MGGGRQLQAAAVSSDVARLSPAVCWRQGHVGFRIRDNDYSIQLKCSDLKLVNTQHVLGNNGLCLCTAAQYVLLFLSTVQ